MEAMRADLAIGTARGAAIFPAMGCGDAGTGGRAARRRPVLRSGGLR
ncbi:hypothetical protein GQF56_24685 [Rhodobacter sphaeroides]|jgi:hypothetical protein|uniref:Uncharacterized protein n=1 Tax=Cereibacter sphaeroides (strain ATCC 17023 / DSM 158 / JCM 6121 / CCUG 31486 / LMG 2827 / NBRC 12203 / NCIMB 8253 / ATH 2.4.1.) TaxID=272943 RepID=U5NR63_CERS4|nr:hypothetical protein RSP_7510 [Cereibacter sphaeroides 2.4.1]EGJ20480.1 hypothetical protein RSWS8N_00340 [Cereibacter sphaeroides WS8N]MVX51000.1 hypothetical protein [Cereibacter sphaeroides]AXC60398.1 hypothetical protein DQL45_03135 [Cereibacter sphaeroides 2.4.1]QHA10505.1 hypothetical protein GQR99_03145 [Cereibacter sphaeroides]